MTRMFRPQWTRQLTTALVLAGVWVAPAVAQSRRQSVAAEEDYLFVCLNEGTVQRCVEVVSSKDLRDGRVTARFNYTEFDTVGPDSRGLSCAIPVPPLALTSNGKRLQHAGIKVTVSPESEACLGSWGIWSPGPVTFTVAMAASGGYSQQFKGHGVVTAADAEYRFTETLESWAVNASGTVDVYDFSGATGSVQTLRRTSVSKTP